ncbi:murein hydrolase activator EnvC family protein [Flammeovirga aprica]|uniref:Peptidoglycan DD-metalloendopeptidase family protein n=1 Tax=Flammeovirga aprica JL-4 TaxID=694437 RepID=A0A7X9RWQ5_9BACT|nr:peptidoglycan DD-metalloendopeptidase family protein [Flammeovirga aprica]NME70100.1 peptidoglycan DD-metalloendopeptidase family protein [Flammeovirga aprica JL-4]
MKKIAFIFLITFIVSPLFAQKDIKTAKDKIAQTKAILDDTQYKKEASLSELNDIEAQIEGREHYLHQIQNRITEAQNEEKEAIIVADSLQRKIELLKEEYAELVYAAYKTGGDFQQLAYIFSSENFTQFVRRANYLEHYKDVRKKQIIEIERSQELLLNKKEEIKARNKESFALLEEEKVQLLQLKSLKERQTTVVSNLKLKERELIAQLEKDRKALAELQRQVLVLTSNVSKEGNVFEDEIEVTAATENKINNKNVTTTNFLETKGSLKWPVEGGVITNHFGVRPHPILSGVTIENHGIDLRVKPNAIVKSVFSGVVTAVTKVPNLQNVIMLRHDNFFTVYSKLNKVNVKVGDIVSINSRLGNAGQNEDGSYEIQFQIWNMDGEKLDPEEWLSKKK